MSKMPIMLVERIALCAKASALERMDNSVAYRPFAHQIEQTPIIIVPTLIDPRSGQPVTAGAFRWNTNEILLSYDYFHEPKHMHQLWNTTLHEIAHVPFRDHGERWRRFAKFLGCTGEELHTMDLTTYGNYDCPECGKGTAHSYQQQKEFLAGQAFKHSCGYVYKYGGKRNPIVQYMRR